MDNKNEKMLDRYVNLMWDLDATTGFPELKTFTNTLACFNLYKFCCMVTSESDQMSSEIEAIML